MLRDGDCLMDEDGWVGFDEDNKEMMDFCFVFSYYEFFRWVFQLEYEFFDGITVACKSNTMPYMQIKMTCIFFIIIQYIQQNSNYTCHTHTISILENSFLEW